MKQKILPSKKEKKLAKKRIPEVRFRNNFSINWEELTWEEVKQRVKYPTETYRLKLLCNHKDTWNDRGMKTCSLCGEVLEVTSYRD